MTDGPDEVVVEMPPGIDLIVVEVPGPMGPRGPQGEPGDGGGSTSPGDKGPTGDKGPQGDPGIQGAPGDKGPTGDKGPVGDRGATGTTGDKGPAGDKGATGTAGAAGIPAFTQIAASPDFAASPQGTITFTGLGGYTDLAFTWMNVSHDYTTANQTFSVAVSVDGVNFSAPIAFTPSISAAGQLNGQAILIGNGQRRPVLRSGMVTGNLSEPGAAAAVENPRVLAVLGAITAIRFTPTTSGNFDAGQIVAHGR